MIINACGQGRDYVIKKKDKIERNKPRKETLQRAKMTVCSKPINAINSAL